MSNEQAITAGKILIADPFMQDPNFKQSVVLLCENNSNGAFGLVMNKPTGILMTEAIEDFPAIECMLFDGGPVEKETVHFLTTRGDIIEDSLYIGEGIYWGGNFDRLKFLLDTKQIATDEVKFFLGYSGWEPGQIEFEMEDNSWIVANAMADILFKHEAPFIWRDVLSMLGGNYKFIANLPNDPNLN